jgi:hypothetical protein
MHARPGRMIRIISFAALLVALAGLVFAQAAPVQSQPPEWLQLMAKSLQALPQYTFKQSTVMKMKGEIKSNTLSQVSFGPDGKPQSTPLSAPPPEQDSGGRGRRGRIKEKVVENKKEEMQEYIQQLVKLSNSYLILSKDKMQALAKSGQVSQDATGMQIIAQDFMQPGDKLILTFDPATKRQRKTMATTTLDGGPVTVTAVYQDLADGLTYNAQTIISAPKKEIEMTMQTFEYVKRTPAH